MIASSLEKAKDRLRELKLERRELIMKKRINMPMSFDEHCALETIDGNVEQQEYLVEWIENSEGDWD